MYFFPDLELVYCSMSSSDHCFLIWPKSLFEFFRKIVPKIQTNFLASPVI